MTFIHLVHKGIVIILKVNGCLNSTSLFTEKKCVMKLTLQPQSPSPFPSVFQSASTSRGRVPDLNDMISALGTLVNT